MMLKPARDVRKPARAATGLNVAIAGVATAAPAHLLSQEDAARRAARIFPQLAGHASLFRNTGIETRYSCEPPEWYEREHGWEARTDAAGDHFWRGTEHIMGWDIKEDGFGVVLSPELPQLLRLKLKPALQGFLDANGMSLGEFNGFLFHPGGAKVLDTVQEALGLSPDDLAHSRAVLRDFGNMSSLTALFALDRAVRAGASGPHLLAVFGPGFSAYFLAVDL
jgi:predicted naringenin-chalcone synthase